MSRNVETIIPIERIYKSIFLVRGHKVIFDKDLADLYGVTTMALNQAVSRNITRFPEDFMFQLNRTEFQNLMFHFGTSRCLFCGYGKQKRPAKAGLLGS